MELFFRHAVRAPKVAAVHHRDAQIMQRSSELIERVLRAANVVNDGGHFYLSVTSDRRWQRILWHRCWALAGAPRNPLFRRDSRNRPNHWSVADWPKGG